VVKHRSAGSIPGILLKVVARLHPKRGITMEQPVGLKEHEAKYHANAWEAYTLEELGHWVHLFAKRSEHRSDAEKKKKDLTDAQNYLDMMQAKLNALKG
jgi:hypothetical protein